MYRVLERLLEQALEAAVACGDLRLADPPACTLETPEHPMWGDATCRVAMRVAQRLGRPASEVASVVARHVLDPHGWLDGVEAAGPGFVNLHASLLFWRAALGRLLNEEVSPAPDAGRAVVLCTVAGQQPLALRARGVADVAGRLLRHAGHEVALLAGPLDGLGDRAAETSRGVVVHAGSERNTARRAKDLVAAAGGRPGRVTAIGVGPVEVRHRGRLLRGAAAADVLQAPAARLLVVGTPAPAAVALDAELVASDRLDNPWVAVRYALRRASRLGGDRETILRGLAALGEAERECLVRLAAHPDVVDAATRRLGPDELVAHARAVAAAFHRYYNRVSRLSGDEAVAVRAAVARGTERVLETTLALLGVAATEPG